jgi:hypothetical protein
METINELKGGMYTMERNYMLTGFALMLVLLLGFSMVSAMPGSEGEISEERLANKEAFRAAVESEDYDAWSSLMEERVARLQDSITEDHFAEVIAGHAERTERRVAQEENRDAFKSALEEARESGDLDSARELREDFREQREESRFNLRSFFGFGRGR